MKNLEMYCVTNKNLNFLDDTNYEIAWVGKEKPPQNYITCDNGDNIFFKEKNYSELTFHYWFWKNKLDVKNTNWIGFCQRRRFWTKIKILENKIEKNEMKKKSFNRNTKRTVKI